MRFDHVGLLVKNTDKTLAALEPFFPSVNVRRRDHPTQDAFITYMTTADGHVMMELVEPTPGNKRLNDWLARENKAAIFYHICMAVADFGAKAAEMKKKGWLALTSPFETFDSGIYASHFYKPEVGIVEITGPYTPPVPR
jgi:methylmalonyl-CoA/ethylmalonyl-CoA epimerase